MNVCFCGWNVKEIGIVKCPQSEPEMEGESSEPVRSTQLTEQVLSKTEEDLKKAVRSNFHVILARATETPISEIDIPLCRMVVMTDVRQSLEIDI